MVYYRDFPLICKSYKNLYDCYNTLPRHLTQLCKTSPEQISKGKNCYENSFLFGETLSNLKSY